MKCGRQQTTKEEKEEDTLIVFEKTTNFVSVTQGNSSLNVGAGRAAALFGSARSTFGSIRPPLLVPPEQFNRSSGRNFRPGPLTPGMPPVPVSHRRAFSLSLCVT